MGRKGRIPKIFFRLHHKTKTPVISTLALFFPIGALAELTTQFILAVFALVNLSLVVLKLRKVAAPEEAYTVGIWVPAGGVIAAVGLLVSPWLI
ncbi:MAG: hypothetical protein ABGW81_11000 [Paracoccaceae bacterium]